MGQETVNRIIIVGEVGNDAIYKDEGVPAIKFNVPTVHKNREGELVTEWHLVVMYGAVAAESKATLNKGDRVYIEGRLETRRWEDSNKVPRQATQVIVDDEGKFINFGKKGGK